MKQNLDPSNMHQVIADSAHQLTFGLALAEKIHLPETYTNLVICGMGGSVLPAEILAALHKTKVPVTIHRDYNLAPAADRQSLVICISYSGNTEETLSALQEAIEQKLTIVGISSGGQLEKICQEQHLPFVKIPSGIQPREATGYLFAALAAILANANLIDDLSADIAAVSQQLYAANGAIEQEGKKLAKKIASKIPVIYSSSPLAAVAQLWKIKFNENSKIPAFWNYFPELNHNEMVGYTGFGDVLAKYFCVIMLKDSEDHPRNIKRMDLTANIIKDDHIQVETVLFQEGPLLYKIFSSLLLASWTSYYAAIEQGIDPAPVAIVEQFKGLMQK